MGKPDIDNIIKALITLRDICKDSKIEIVEILAVGATGANHHDARKVRVEVDVRLLLQVGKG